MHLGPASGGADFLSRAVWFVLPSAPFREIVWHAARAQKVPTSSAQQGTSSRRAALFISINEDLPHE
jgi:hypothetical protein